MTREDLARDILLASIPICYGNETFKELNDAELFRVLAVKATEQADALLEALGAKEAPASWLSKEMRTPAKGFPAINAESGEPLPVCIGCRVVIAESLDPKLTPWYGRTGIVGHPCRRYAETLWQVRLGTGDELLVPESCLERVE